MVTVYTPAVVEIYKCWQLVAHRNNQVCDSETQGIHPRCIIVCKALEDAWSHSLRSSQGCQRSAHTMSHRFKDQPPQTASAQVCHPAARRFLTWRRRAQRRTAEGAEASAARARALQTRGHAPPRPTPCAPRAPGGAAGPRVPRGGRRAPQATGGALLLWFRFYVHVSPTLLADWSVRGRRGSSLLSRRPGALEVVTWQPPGNRAGSLRGIPGSQALGEVSTAYSEAESEGKQWATNVLTS